MFSGLFRKKKSYKFSDAETTVCITCSHVTEEKAPILYVSHDEDDGMWQFLCGSGKHEEHHAKLGALIELSNIDPTINQLYELPVGFCAIRETVEKPWTCLKS